MTSSIPLLSFSMRTTPPKDGADWFRIVEAKKASEPTKVYIYDEIGYWGTNAKDFAAILDDIDTDEIHVHLNSPGGSVFDGLAIHATLKNHKAKVTAIVDGMAASAASFILQAADERQISRNAQIMIHDAKAYAGGNAEQMRKAADLLDRVSDSIADIYAVRSGEGFKSADEFRSIMKSGDQWYNGNEALAEGLVDAVTDNPDEDTPDEAENVWSAADVEAFLQTPPEKLAASAHVTITNRVEEALMTGTSPQNNQTPPPVQTPPAPAPAASAPEAPAPAPVAAAPEVKFMVNGTEVTDLNAVQAHIAGLESFKKETIESARKNFVAQLAADKKILANDETIEATETFALSLSAEQFQAWKATMNAAQPNPLFNRHGVTPTEQGAPVNGVQQEVVNEITTLEEIVQAHRDSGMPQAEIETKDSWKKLQQLKQSQQTGA